MIDESELEMIDECAFVMPRGAYFDDDDVLRAGNGDALPDGAYQTDDGRLLIYEGNFERMMSL
ncbi:hypothetical protein HLV38_02970 [Berryella wangjianweii]|uniref:Uncharacterized protein n=1 Tax=Berryella wangjianweii TaxID=2734634 RepID=A0A6M8J720_9ACTN|nr:hypothetical protein [Berryella wangjianweii]QKF07199.1 hypothetical protein HLV38_02970 [Berryella wangjianweii]